MAGSGRVLLLFCTVASVICSVFCKWNYYSYTEALTDDNHLCLGECDTGECVIDWWAHTKPCHPTNEETKYYTSYDILPCLSNCDKYGKGYEWCVTAEDDWDYCNRSLALKGRYKHTTHNERVTCSGECGPQGYSYDWCTTVTRWEECYVNEQYFVPEYPTDQRTRCETPCKLFKSDHEARCFDTNKEWVRCYLNPEYDQKLHSITHKIRTECKNKHKFGNYTSKGFRPCTNTSLKSKRDSDYSFNACDLDVSTVAERHRANNPTDQVRTIRPHRPVTPNPDPILSYTMMPRRVRFGARGNPRDLDLPLVVEAQVTNFTLVPPGGRERFITDVTNHFRLMNPNGRNIIDNYDERGHILGSRVGGPMAPFNIIPQPWRLNRGSGSSWFQMEEHMANFVRDRDDRYVEFLAVVGYLREANGDLITRPDHIGIRLRFHEGNIWTDRHGNRIDRPEDNETENMFFSNNPEDDCNVDMLW